MEPKDTAQPWPTSTMAAARAGRKPAIIINGAATATGTPKPVMPWMKLEKPQAMSSACASRSSVTRAMARPMTSMPPTRSTTLYM